jgi:hypothetical protein
MGAIGLPPRGVALATPSHWSLLADQTEVMMTISPLGGEKVS